MLGLRAKAWVLDVGSGRRVAAGTHHVVEYLLSPKTIRLPRVPTHCPGVLIWRGRILPTVDLAPLWSSPAPASHEPCGAIILAYQDALGNPLRYGALLVYATPEETWVSNDMACPLPEESSALQYFACACFANQQQPIPVLDTTKLFCETLPWTPPPPESKEQDAGHIATPSSRDSLTPESDPRPEAPVRLPAATAADVNQTVAVAEATPEERRALQRARAQQVIEETLEAIYTEVGLKRVIFAGLASDRRSIRTTFYRGDETDSPLRSLHIERGNSSLFAQLVKKPAGVWLNAVNRDRLARHMSAEMRESLGESEFFACSVFVRSKLVGMCYADEFPMKNCLDEHRYRQFKELCNSMTTRLGESETRIGPMCSDRMVSRNH